MCPYCVRTTGAGRQWIGALPPACRVCVRQLLQNRFSIKRAERPDIHRVVVKILQLTGPFRHRERSPTGVCWRGLVIRRDHLREELREYARTRCAEQLRKERTYELPGHLRGEPVAVNATIGGKFDACELRHLKPAPNGLFPWFDAPDKMVWLSPRQVGSLANQTKIYECQVYAVHTRALLRIASGVITTTAQIDALNWPL